MYSAELRTSMRADINEDRVKPHCVQIGVTGMSCHLRNYIFLFVIDWIRFKSWRKITFRQVALYKISDKTNGYENK